MKTSNAGDRTVPQAQLQGSASLRFGQTTSGNTCRFERRTFLVAKVFLLLQFLWIFSFSLREYADGVLTLDFAIFNQARWSIAHGNLNPVDSLNGFQYWRSHGEFIMWPVALATKVLPGPGALWLLLLQDAAIFGCGWMTLRISQEIIGKQEDQRQRCILGIFVSSLILLNPWIYETGAFDFHFEALGTFFSLLALSDLRTGRYRRVTLWSVLVLSTGAVSAFYLVGVGIAGFLSYRSVRYKAALAVLLGGLGWILLLGALNANEGSFLAAGYGYLAGPAHGTGNFSVAGIAHAALTHPTAALRQLLRVSQDIWANLSPVGIIGILSPLGFGITLTVLLPNSLYHGTLFAVPGFQNFPVYPFVLIGTVQVLTLAGRGRAMRGHPIVLRRAACACLASLSVGWALAWLPEYPSQWLRVTPAGAAALAEARQIIPRSAEVVASQGVVGRLSGRRWVYAISGSPLTVPIRAKLVFFVVTPSQGIEEPVQNSESLLAQIATIPGSQLLEHRAGVWVFSWSPPASVKSVKLQGPEETIPAWTLDSKVGEAVVAGPVSTWYMTSNGSSGYLIYGDYFFTHQGEYDAQVRLSSTGRTFVEVWNSSTKTLLARRELVAVTGVQTITLPFAQPLAGSESVFRGRSLFAINPIAPPEGQPVEVRVYDQRDVLTNVYTVSITKA